MSRDEVKNLIQSVCPVCKKKYYAAPDHAWKIGSGAGRRVCSYSCMRKWEKANKFKTRDEGGRRKK